MTPNSWVGPFYYDDAITVTAGCEPLDKPNRAGSVSALNRKCVRFFICNRTFQLRRLGRQ